MESQSSENPLATLSSNIPAFNTTNTKSWFVQIQALFDAKRITSPENPVLLLSGKLPADIVEEVMDLLENVPDDNPYDRLKEAILKRTGASNEAMLRNLFTQVELGDRTPSQLLKHMRTLLVTNKLSENIMRSLWLDKLPTTTTQILAPMTEETQTEKLADIADRIHESFRSRRVNSIQPQPSQQRDREFNALKSTVERLSIQLQGLLQKDRQYRRDKCPGYRKRSFSRGRTDNRNRKDKICLTTTKGLVLRRDVVHILVLSTTRMRETEIPASRDDGCCWIFLQKVVCFISATKLMDITFLIDTGAEISVISPTQNQETMPQSYHLQAANGIKIPTYGEKSLNINLGMRRNFFLEFYHSQCNNAYIRGHIF
ncbi:unnamed protein product [Acanthosepion pharaonis]|uniref:Peptidase A2 domain-containing protein n=1 Tax=Acanthosepion pharaonis TaxID=158019 RepID=A0A812DZV2_ACAPH|nr:unnamed protein product [Sepia pharaonis]